MQDVKEYIQKLKKNIKFSWDLLYISQILYNRVIMMMLGVNRYEKYIVIEFLFDKVLIF